MNADRFRTLALSLPYVQETTQWGDNLVFWVGDKSLGGKMFALLALDAAPGSGQPLLSFAVGPERYHELLEQEDIVAAPYLARAFWVAVLGWGVFSAAGWQEHLTAAHARTLAKLSRGTRALLDLPPAEQRRALADRQRTLAARAAAGPARPPRCNA